MSGRFINGHGCFRNRSFRQGYLDSARSCPGDAESLASTKLTTATRSFSATNWKTPYRLLGQNLAPPSCLLARPEHSPFDLYLSRNQVLHHYSGCGLTKKTDRLAAISGIIAKIERTTGWENCAGLWSPFFVYELLWSRREERKARVSYTGIGPSWSWTTISGRLCHGPLIPKGESSKIVYAAKAKVAIGGSDIPKLATLKGGIHERGRPILRISSSPLIPYQTTLGTIALGKTVSYMTHLSDLFFRQKLHYTSDVRSTKRTPEIVLPLVLKDTTYKDGTSTLGFYGIAITRSVHSSEVYERVGFVCREGVPNCFRKLPNAHTPEGLAKCKTFTLI